MAGSTDGWIGGKAAVGLVTTTGLMSVEGPLVKCTTAATYT